MNDIKVGTSITKLVNNKLKSVKVKEIKTINKKVKYYFVASTRYYNIIANDFVTTDAFTEILIYIHLIVILCGQIEK